MLHINLDQKSVLTAQGHGSKYDPNSLCCLAVSTATEMLECGLKRVLGLRFPTRRGYGNFRFDLSVSQLGSEREKIDLLLETYLETLDSIRKLYPKELTITSFKDKNRFPSIEVKEEGGKQVFK